MPSFSSPDFSTPQYQPKPDEHWSEWLFEFSQIGAVAAVVGKYDSPTYEQFHDYLREQAAVEYLTSEQARDGLPHARGSVVYAQPGNTFWVEGHSSPVAGYKTGERLFHGPPPVGVRY
jgi:hypothetical protein